MNIMVNRVQEQRCVLVSDKFQPAGYKHFGFWVLFGGFLPVKRFGLGAIA